MKEEKGYMEQLGDVFVYTVLGCAFMVGVTGVGILAWGLYVTFIS
jgi:hypothetical protein